MPDVSQSDDVQLLGQLPSPAEIGRQIEVLTQRAAEAQRTVLKCHLEIAKLLAIMAEHHGFKSRRYIAFASEHGGLSRTDAYDLIHLAQDADEIVAEHDAETRDDPRHQWPSWRQALKDLEPPPEPGGYWLTPASMFEELEEEFGEMDDPFPYPRPADYDALADDCEWGQVSYVNASFRTTDEGRGRSLSNVAVKAIAEMRKGKTIVMAVPCYDSLAQLLMAKPEVRPLGRVKWLHTSTGQPCPAPGPCALIILRGSKPDGPPD